MDIPKPNDLLGQIYSEWIEEMTKYPDMSLNLLRIIFEDWQRATKEPTDVTYEYKALNDVKGMFVFPKNADSEKIILFMHGGGFALGSSNSHRKMVAHISKAMNVNAFIVDFRLAPEYPYPAPLDDCSKAFDRLLEIGYSSENIIPMGDSAGGNLALSTVLRRIKDNQVIPKAVVVISPWLNMENNGETLITNNDTDFLIAKDGLQANIDRYLSGKIDPKNPEVNPLYADFTGFPKLYINAGSVESLVDNSTQLYEITKKYGVDATLSIGDGMQHVFTFLAGNHSQADEEITNMANWYKSI